MRRELGWIREMDDIIQHATYEKRAPVREKYPAVEPDVWTKVVPIMIAFKMNDL